MPLLKLWNAMWGRSAVAKSAAQPSDAPKPTSAAPAEKPVSTQLRRARGTGFNLFGSNPHAALCKQVGAIRAKTVLEVAVGDGSRAIAVMGTLAKSGDPIRYFGIDQFELAGGAVSLKDFHRTLRAAGIRAQIFPEPVDRGLARFLHTIGMVDLVLLSEPAEILDDVRVRQLLTRISHPETTILYLQDETWVRLAARNSPALRAA